MGGSVEAVGKNVTGFQPGDQVFGGLEGRGTLAEYISIRHDAVVLKKPANLTFEQAASGPIAGRAHWPPEREVRPRRGVCRSARVEVPG
jgi:NADPH:quinone reductase-like Zn-dependent oxidoreductase